MTDLRRTDGIAARRLSHTLACVASLCACGGRSGEAFERPDAAAWVVTSRLPGSAPIDAGRLDAGPLDAGRHAAAAHPCGLSFAEAVAAHPGESVCKTLLYSQDSGYCEYWRPCSEL